MEPVKDLRMPPYGDANAMQRIAELEAEVVRLQKIIDSSVTVRHVTRKPFVIEDESD